MQIPYFDKNGEMIVLEGTAEEIFKQVQSLREEMIIIDMEPIDE